MSYSVVDVADLPTVWGTFKFVRHHLGARAFGLSQIDFPPDKVGSEHDERESRQEEVYLTLSGGGTLEVGAGESVLVPSGVSHRVDALEDSVVLDAFAPRREDWLRGDDAYLRGPQK